MWFLMLWLWLSSASAEPGRVVAIGDLHGDMHGALQALQLAGVIDQDARWSGGETALVQTGDLFDRGADGRWIATLLVRLQAEARAAGGAVHVLMGNHEAMNLLGDWRYVTPGDLLAFGGEGPRRAAMSREQPLGAWMAALPAVVKVHGTVFVHGGLDSAWARLGVDAINQQVHRAIAGGGGPALGATGPLWYRGLATEPEETMCPKLTASLAAVGGERMVIGHTVAGQGAILPRCEGRLFAIDTGISSYYGGHVAIWEQREGGIFARTPTEERRLIPLAR
ncbi:MAG: metallophosphoesterase [Deltaproteobacteria bacterium]|nr:metallophosphoesterase [Deltaproteobacteria bacterium]